MGRYGSIPGAWVRKRAGLADLADATTRTARATHSTTLTEREKERNVQNVQNGSHGGREGQPSANSNECSGSSSGGGGKDDDGEYYANMGDALRVLREDVPQLFSKELNVSIYRDDVVFTDGRLEFQGLKNYKIIFWSLRFHSKLFFRHTNVDILRIWQPEDYQIKMRWKIVGIPRVGDMEGVIDGISTYKLDRRGKIYEHSITNVQLRYVLTPSLARSSSYTPVCSDALTLSLSRSPGIPHLRTLCYTVGTGNIFPSHSPSWAA